MFRVRKNHKKKLNLPQKKVLVFCDIYLRYNPDIYHKQFRSYYKKNNQKGCKVTIKMLIIFLTDIFPPATDIVVDFVGQLLLHVLEIQRIFPNGDSRFPEQINIKSLF